MVRPGALSPLFRCLHVLSNWRLSHATWRLLPITELAFPDMQHPFLFLVLVFLDVPSDNSDMKYLQHERGFRAKGVRRLVQVWTYLLEHSVCSLAGDQTKFFYAWIHVLLPRDDSFCKCLDVLVCRYIPCGTYLAVWNKALNCMEAGNRHIYTYIINDFYHPTQSIHPQNDPSFQFSQPLADFKKCASLLSLSPPPSPSSLPEHQQDHNHLLLYHLHHQLQLPLITQATSHRAVTRDGNTIMPCSPSQAMLRR